MEVQRSDSCGDERQQPVPLLPVALLMLFAVALSFYPLPFANEFYYLIRIETFWQPQAFANDWLLSQRSPEHSVFNATVGLLPLLLPIEITGWIGRVLCWIGTVWALIRLGRHFHIRTSLILASIGLWLASGQSIVGGEWVLNGFEAKCLAYILLFTALDLFLRARWLSAAVVLGLSFSFHPGVGLWAVTAVGIALLMAGQKSPRQLVTIAAVTGFFALPGLIPIYLKSTAIVDSSPNDWEFMVRTIMPNHTDPSAWARRDIAATYVLYLFNLLHALRHRRDPAFRFLLGFQTGLCLIFTIGLVWRAAGLFDLLKYMPFRLFPVFALLFFFFHLSKLLCDLDRGRLTPILALIAALALTGLPSALGTTYDRIVQIRNAWNTPQSGLDDCLDWLRDNADNRAHVLAPPWNRGSWWRSRHAQFVSSVYLPYDRLAEWRERIEMVIGKLEVLPEGPHALETKVMEGFRSLSPAQVAAIASKYGVTHLVSDRQFPFRPLFSSRGYIVYALDGNHSHAALVGSTEHGVPQPSRE